MVIGQNRPYGDKLNVNCDKLNVDKSVKCDKLNATVSFF